MSSNKDVLFQKFQNFKAFIKQEAKSPQVKVLEAYTDQQFLQYSAVLKQFHENGKLQELVDKTVQELEIDAQHKDKIMRYYLCFLEYLNLAIKAEELIPVK